MPVDGGELPLLRELVGGGEEVDRLAGGEALGQQLDPDRPGAGVGAVLGGDGADAGAHPGAPVTDRDGGGRYADAEHPGLRVAGREREGQGIHPCFGFPDAILALN